MVEVNFGVRNNMSLTVILSKINSLAKDLTGFMDKVTTMVIGLKMLNMDKVSSIFTMELFTKEGTKLVKDGVRAN